MLIDPPMAPPKQSELLSQKPSSVFQVDSSLIEAVPLSQQDEELQALGLTVFNQQEFEQGLCDMI